MASMPMDAVKNETRKRILALDIGGTIMQCCLFDDKMKLLSEAKEKMEYVYPAQHCIEIDPDVLWRKVKDVVKDCVKNGGITVEDVSAFGISAFRSTFITWNKTTGEPFHNFISWQDSRSSRQCIEWNNSFTMMGLRNVAGLLFCLTRSKKYIASKMFKFEPTQIVTKLEWMLNNCAKLRDEIDVENACFGTLDTWLIWKFTNGKKFCSEIGHASSTSLFDPFTLDWSGVILYLAKVPRHILPSVIGTSGSSLCEIEEDVFGGKMTLHSLVGDQNAAFFASGGCKSGDVVCTMGTGSFIDVATQEAHGSMGGLYPQIGWQIGDDICYLAEGLIHSSAQAVDWSATLGLYDDVSETSDLAYSVTGDHSEICFVPALSGGLRVPVKDASACASFFGINRSTTRVHLLKAILEGVAFSFCSLFETAENEIGIPAETPIKVNGGISNNKFIVEVISTVLKRDVLRSRNSNMSLLGAAHLAGLGAGVWSCREELLELRDDDDLIQPNGEQLTHYSALYSKWKDAAHRCVGWYSEQQP